MVAKVGAEVVIIGAGPSGIAVADTLLAAGRSVAMVPGGSWRSAPDLDPGTATISRGSGWPHEPVNQHRRFGIGGAGNLWGGRCVSLDPIDFERRSWVPNSGWPISYEDYAKWLPLAAEFLKVMPFPDLFQERPMWGEPLAQSAFDEHTLEAWSPLTEFSRVFRERLWGKPNFQLWDGFFATSIRTNDSGVVTSIKIESDKETVELRPRLVVLAAGTLESTRLLLNWGLGSSLPFLGKYYMSHLWMTGPSFGGRALDPSVDFFRKGGTYRRRRWTLKATTQEKFEIGNASIFAGKEPFSPVEMHKDGISSLIWIRKMLSGQFGLSAPFTSYSKRLTDHLANVISDRRRVLQFLQTQYFSPGGRPPLAISSHSQPPWTAWIQAEHFPNRNSFVELNQRRDRFGLRQLDVKIDFGEGDFRNLSRTHNLFAEEAQRRGFAVTTEQSLPPSHFRHLLARKFNSNAHQAGTTRMGTSPRDSVVDKNLRVHGLRNLYTLSGGVFPTFGHANPTLSLVVLGIRLGTKISSEISNPLSPK